MQKIQERARLLQSYKTEGAKEAESQTYSKGNRGIVRMQ